MSRRAALLCFLERQLIEPRRQRPRSEDPSAVAEEQAWQVAAAGALADCSDGATEDLGDSLFVQDVDRHAASPVATAAARRT